MKWAISVNKHVYLLAQKKGAIACLYYKSQGDRQIDQSALSLCLLRKRFGLPRSVLTSPTELTSTKKPRIVWTMLRKLGNLCWPRDYDDHTGVGRYSSDKL